jgi:hypothetical protein
MNIPVRNGFHSTEYIDNIQNDECRINRLYHHLRITGPS